MVRCGVMACVVFGAVAGALAADVAYDVDSAATCELNLVQTTPVKLGSFTSLDDVVPIVAAGESNLADLTDMRPYFSKRTEDGLRVDFQQRSTDKYVKCVQVLFFEQGGSVYVKQLCAYYWSGKDEVGWAGTHTWGDREVIAFSLYDGKGGTTQYGIRSITVGTPKSHATALAEDAKMTVADGNHIVLSGDAVPAVLPNDLTINRSIVTVCAAQDAAVTGTVSGTAGILRLETSQTVARTPLATEQTLTGGENENGTLTKTDKLIFPGASFDAFTITDVVMSGNVEGYRVSPYFVKTNGNVRTVEYQLENDIWVKCVKVAYTEKAYGIYGRSVRAYYYKRSVCGPAGTLSVDVEEDRAAMVASGGKDDWTIDEGTGKAGYGIRSVTADYVKRNWQIFPTNLRTLSGSPHTRHAFVTQGYDLGDLVDVCVRETSGFNSVTNETIVKRATLDGTEYQYQALTSDGYLKLLSFRLFQTAGNAIYGLVTRVCAFTTSRLPGSAFGSDLSEYVPSHPDSEYNLYTITKLGLLFSSTAVPSAVLTRSGSSTLDGTVAVAAGSHVRVAVPDAVTDKGVLSVEANARVTLTNGVASARGYYLTAAPGAEVTAVGYIGYGIDSVWRHISLDHATLRILKNNEFLWDCGEYVTLVTLRNGALLSGCPVRGTGEKSCRLVVTGTGCSTNDAGVILCNADDSQTYEICVADTTGDAAVDLEFGGHIGIHTGAQKGGMSKTGAGTMRLTTDFAQHLATFLRLDEGTVILGRNKMLTEAEGIVFNGGALEVAPNVTGNVTTFALKASSTLALGDNATLTVADSSAKEWNAGARLNVTLAKTAHLYGEGLTDDRLEQIRINRRHVQRMENGEIRARTEGFVFFIQ